MAGASQSFDNLPLEDKYNFLVGEYNKLQGLLKEMQTSFTELRNENVTLREKIKSNDGHQMDEDDEEENEEDSEEDDSSNGDNGEINAKKPRKSSSSSEYYSPKKTNESPKRTTKSSNQVAATTKKTGRTPPAIIAFFTNHKEMIGNLTKHLNNNKFTVFIKKDNVKIVCESNTEYKASLEFLKNSNVHYYTFTPKEEKPTTLVIKNFSNTYESDEIIAAIEEKIPGIQVNNVKNLFKYNWLIQVKTKEDVKSMKSIRSLLGHGIKVENFKGNKQIQCKRCQRYNHVASNCSMPYRCVKCGCSHEIGVCTIPKKDLNTKIYTTTSPDGTEITQKGLKLKCANCSGDHAASYSKCPSRPTPAPVFQPKSVIQPKISHQSVRKDNVTYSQALKNNVNNFDLNSEVTNMFGKSLIECVTRINNFIPQYKEANDINAKKTSLFQFMFELCLN